MQAVGNVLHQITNGGNTPMPVDFQARPKARLATADSIRLVKTKSSFLCFGIVTVMECTDVYIFPFFLTHAGHTRQRGKHFAADNLMVRVFRARRQHRLS